MINQWRNALLTVVLGAVALAIGPSAVAEGIERQIENGTITELIQAQQSESNRLTETDPVIATANEWFTQFAQADLIEITSIEVEETTQGFTLQLQTNGDLDVDETLVAGNAAIADIPNAVLNLPEGEDFLVSNPAEGIALVSVSALPDNRVRIAITGADAPPTVDFQVNALGLTASVDVGTTSTQTPDDEAIRLTVTGEQTDDDYFVPESSTATRTDTPLRDIPNAIQVIPRQVIEDQQATGLEEVIENAAGVTFLGTSDGRGFNPSIRGFRNVPILRDGVLSGSRFGGDSAGPEVANLERVEVLRGLASVLYGRSEPGGVINLVTKRPLSNPYYSFQIQGGNRNFFSPSMDISGPLTEDGRLLYRLNALYRTEESFRNYDNSFERFFIAPTVTALINEDTELTVGLEYSEDRDPADFGTLAFGNGIAPISPEQVSNSPEDTVDQTYLSVGYALEHRFSEDWKLRNQFRYTSNAFDFSVLSFPTALNEETGILNRTFVTQSNDDDVFAFNTSIQGDFNTGSIEHTLLFGVDVQRREGELISRGDNSSIPLDIFDPDYSVGVTPSAESLPILGSSTALEENLIGVYVQNQIDILDNLILVAGLRYDTVDVDSTNIVAGTTTNQNSDALTPRVGIVYQPIEPVSLYANYSRSFVPNTATDADGNLLEPEEGEGFEFGIRSEIVEGRLAATLAYFDITKQNVATGDPAAPFASIATGEERSRGVDFDLTGEILPGWNVVASYAYIDAEVTADNNAEIVGSRLTGVPEHSASLWTTYQIQAGSLQGLGFGIGANFVGERQGGLPNSFEVDSYFRVDAAVSYQRRNWQAHLNIDNLFDIDYVESAGDTNRVREIYPGDPLTVRASLSYTF